LSEKEDSLSASLVQIEDRFFSTVATTAKGLLLQIKEFRECKEEDEFSRMFMKSIEAGIKRLSKSSSRQRS
jgi:hypothetical protein